jgi:hypothetical protein
MGLSLLLCLQEQMAQATAGLQLLCQPPLQQAQKAEAHWWICCASHDLCWYMFDCLMLCCCMKAVMDEVAYSSRASAAAVLCWVSMTDADL